MKLHNSEVIFFCSNKNFVKWKFKKQLVPDRLLPRLNILLFPYSVHHDKLKSIPESEWGEKIFRPQIKAENQHQKPLFYRECCGKPFTSLKRFKFHKLKFHSEYSGSGIQFKCKVCDKIYNTRTALKIHIKTEHRIQRPKKASNSGSSHMCELCKFTIFFLELYFGRNHDGVNTRRGIVSHGLREEKPPQESFPRSSFTNSMGTLHTLNGSISLY